MHGTTWSLTVDAMLDELNRRDRDRQQCLDAMIRLCTRRPELDTDPDMVLAMMAALR